MMEGWPEPPDFLRLTLDEEIQRLIAMHGRGPVKEAAARLSRRRHGRPEMADDAELLASIVKADAVDWLEERDPFKVRTNTAIARQFAERLPGHSVESTMRRIQGKLSKYRRRAAVVAAYILTGSAPAELAQVGLAAMRFPYSGRFRALEALAAGGDPYWRNVLAFERAQLNDYRKLHGEPPADMTWREIMDSPKQLMSIDAASLTSGPA